MRVERATSVVEASIARLPDALRSAASRTPCLYRSWHPNVENGDESARELLGEYLSFGDIGQVDESGTIVLYIEAIDLFCREEGLVFEDEVRNTYLHELGHHFGWDEDDLESRGL